HELRVGGVAREQRGLHRDPCVALRARRRRLRRERRGLGHRLRARRLALAGLVALAGLLGLAGLVAVLVALVVLVAEEQQRSFGAAELFRGVDVDTALASGGCQAAGERDEGHAECRTDPIHHFLGGLLAGMEPCARRCAVALTDPNNVLTCRAARAATPAHFAATRGVAHPRRCLARPVPAPAAAPPRARFSPSGPLRTRPSVTFINPTTMSGRI